MDSTLPNSPAQLLGNFACKILKKSPYKFHFPKNFRLRRANPENVLRAAIVSIWSPEFGARSYCVDLVSRNAFWAAIEGGALIRDSTVLWICFSPRYLILIFEEEKHSLTPKTRGAILKNVLGGH